MQHLVLLHDHLKNLRVEIKSEIKEVLWPKSGFQCHATFSLASEIKEVLWQKSGFQCHAIFSLASEINQVLWQESGFQCHATFSFVARPPQKRQSANQE